MRDLQELHKHSDTHAAHGNNAGDVKTPAALRTHQTSLGTHAASLAASSLRLSSRGALVGIAGVLLRNNLRIVRRWLFSVILHGSVYQIRPYLFQVPSECKTPVFLFNRLFFSPSRFSLFKLGASFHLVKTIVSLTSKRISLS